MCSASNGNLIRAGFGANVPNSAHVGYIRKLSTTSVNTSLVNFGPVTYSS